MNLGKEQLGKMGVGVSRAGREIREDRWVEQMDCIIYIHIYIYELIKNENIHITSIYK